MKTRFAAPPGRQEILVTREFDAPRELVWLAHVDPKHFARWFGCRDMTTRIDRFEARTGGSFRFAQRPPHAEEEFFSRGVFHEVASPERIVKTVELENEPGHVILESTRFEAIGRDRTRVTVHSVFGSVADRDRLLERGAEKGTGEAFERSGTGPAVILVDGALCSRGFGPSAAIAKILAERFTVIRYDRRGRGESADAPEYSIEREVDDLAAIARETGEAPHLFGMSSGALLALRAAARGVPVKSVALFEPPSAGDAAAHLARLEGYLAEGRPGRAVKHFLVDMVGVPRPIAALMQLLPPIGSKLKAVAPTLPYDARLLSAGAPGAQALEARPVSALVLWGGKSAAALREAAQRFAAAIPNARTRELPGQNHNVSAKALAPVLTEFFGGERM